MRFEEWVCKQQDLNYTYFRYLRAARVKTYWMGLLEFTDRFLRVDFYKKESHINIHVVRIGVVQHPLPISILLRHL